MLFCNFCMLDRKQNFSIMAINILRILSHSVFYTSVPFCCFGLSSSDGFITRLTLRRSRHRNVDGVCLPTTLVPGRLSAAHGCSTLSAFLSCKPFAVGGFGREQDIAVDAFSPPAALVSLQRLSPQEVWPASPLGSPDG
jgi:hypothetical protein